MRIHGNVNQKENAVHKQDKKSNNPVLKKIKATRMLKDITMIIKKITYNRNYQIDGM